MYGVDASEQPQRLRSDQLNESVLAGGLMTKRYLGPDAGLRAATEARALRAAHPTVPVPKVVNVTEDSVSYEFVPGRIGAEALDADRAARVLAACGRVLAAVHAVPVTSIQAEAAPGVFTHGDFGPHNLVFDTATDTVAAVLDWEWAHIGQPVEDLAWCEWIVRTHHPDCADALPHLFHGYGIDAPPWSRRQAAMLAKCRAMQQFAARRHNGTATEWRRRAAITQAWRG